MSIILKTENSRTKIDIKRLSMPFFVILSGLLANRKIFLPHRHYTTQLGSCETCKSWASSRESLRANLRVICCRLSYEARCEEHKDEFQIWTYLPLHQHYDHYRLKLLVKLLAIAFVAQLVEHCTRLARLPIWFPAVGLRVAFFATGLSENCMWYSKMYF